MSVAKHYRYRSPHETLGWAERAVDEQHALHDLRQHPAFQALLDVLDADLIALFDRWMKADDESEALALHAQARVLRDMILRIESTTTAHAKALEAERLIRRRREDMGRRTAALNAAR